MQSRTINHTLAVILTYLSLRYLRDLFGLCLAEGGTWDALGEDGQLVLLVYSKIIILLAVTFIVFRTSPLKLLGMDRDLMRGAFWGSLAVLPMFLGYGWMAGFHTSLSLHLLHRDIVLAGFFEEFLFRAFLFGLLFHKCGLGFITANLIPSLFFGLGHLYQAQDLTEATGIFVFTALANVGFSWFYLAWGNLWFVVFLHGCMDLAWDMFGVEGNVTGTLYVNLFRILTLVLAILFSIRYGGSNWKTLLKGKLWINRSENSLNSQPG